MTADRITDALDLLTRAVETHDGAPADTNLARAQVLATIAVAEQLAKLTQAVAAQHGPPAPAPDTTGGQAEQPAAPRVMVNDVWRAHDDERTHDDGRVTDDDWRATDIYGGLLLMLGDYPATWAEANRDHGPLRLVRRAGYRRTETVVSAGRLRPGMVVSCPDWCDGAPVRLLTVQALNADGETEVTYEPLGDDAVGTGTAAPDVRTTLWFGRAVDRG